MVDRTLKELTNDDIAHITETYHVWRGEELVSEKEQSKPYQDIAGYCKSATVADMKANDYVLTPGRYVGAAEIEDDGIPFETKMTELSQTLYSQMNQAEELDKAIRKNLEALGYGM
jgi:type I restriction enzyme M protein